MKKIENIIDSCENCRYCEQFNDTEIGLIAYICSKNEPEKKLIRIDMASNNVNIPSWCPLETYDIGTCEATKTVKLCGLEWMTENLTGHGGTEIDGNWYYTWGQAMKAAEEIGDGWRLPTREEFVKLCELDNAWDTERKNRLFGGKLFLPTAGYLDGSSGELYGVGSSGLYWSTLPTSEDYGAGYFGFYGGGVHPFHGSRRAYRFSVRCVRDIKK